MKKILSLLIKLCEKNTDNFIHISLFGDGSGFVSDGSGSVIKEFDNIKELDNKKAVNK
jgi:hypothetical protein